MTIGNEDHFQGYTDSGVPIDPEKLTATSTTTETPKRNANQISSFEAMSRNRKERRRLGKINGKKIPGITFPITKPKLEQ